MLKVFIPTVRKISEDNEKSYTVYCVEVHISGRCHMVERRYKQFEELHKQLKKTIHIPYFPPKKVFKWNPKVIEQRRQFLEAYLQGIIDRGTVPKSLCNFLEIELQSTQISLSTESLDALQDEEGITHQPVLVFQGDPFIYAEPNKVGGLPDIVVQGVNIGLYGSSDDLR